MTEDQRPGRPRGKTVEQAQDEQQAAPADLDPISKAARRETERRKGSMTLALADDQEFFTTAQIQALWQLGIKGATPYDLAVYLHVCKQTQLDPFSRQIHMIKRQVWNNDTRTYEDRWTIQTGISGYQVIRDRAARRDGVTVEYEDTIWYDTEGGDHDVWLKPEPPYAARVVVLKDGRRFPGVVLWNEVAGLKDGKPVAEWKHQPVHMLEKCAEAFALRRAFPNDLSGLYTDEEMARFDTDLADPGPRRASQNGPSRRGPVRPARASAAAATAPPRPDSPMTGTVIPEAGEPAPADRPKNERQQAMARLHALCGELGLGGPDMRPARLAALAFLRSRSPLTDPRDVEPVTSSSELSDEDLAHCVTELAEVQARFAAAEPRPSQAEIKRQALRMSVAGGWQPPKETGKK